MPHYDSGIPNQWNLMKAVTKYFSKHEYKQIIVYCDFYNEAIARGLNTCEWQADRGDWRFSLVQPYTRKVFINGPEDNYVNLMEPARLERLREAVYKEVVP
jgi:hypothetical protein